MQNVLASIDEPIVELGLKSLFDANANFTLLRVCRTHPETVAWAKTQKPDLILYGLPLTDKGLKNIEELHWIAPESSIVFWCREISGTLAHQLVGMGVKGFLDTSASPDSILDCLRISSVGQIWMERSLTASLLNLRPINLSRRQSELLRLLLLGLKNKEIAVSMGISETTVKAYLTTMFKKVGAKDRFELALYGLKNHRDLAGSGAGVDRHPPTPDRPKANGRGVGWRTVA